MAPLKVTILGAGIAGFTAALALRQQGHHVTLLERADALQDAGAAIMLGPNCSILLMRLGMKPEAVGANLYLGAAMYHGDGQLKMRSDLEKAGFKWANPWYLIHRVDLHKELARLALDPEGTGPVPELLLGCQITDVDVKSAEVRLQGGWAFKGDVVLGADGNRSAARNLIDPDIKPTPWYLTAYRWLVPRDVLLADPETRMFVEDDGYFGEVLQGDRRFVMYPCRGNTSTNFVAFVPNEEANPSGGDFNQVGDKDLLEKAFERFFPQARKLLSYSRDLRVWRLLDMETMESWVKGRLALLGDAAHPFLPFLGQGGAMAMEDAVCLAQVLPEGTPAGEVPERLKLYGEIRHERATHVQRETRRAGLPEGQKADNSLNVLGFCHNHDEWENSKEKLQEWLKQKDQANNG